MTSADRDMPTSFDHALDALVTGTPEHDLASNRTSDPAASADLRRAAHQFHGLAARADRSSKDAAPRQTLDTIWENVMNAHAPSATTVAPSTGLISARPRPQSRPKRIIIAPGTARWQGIANAVLAAVLTLAIATGFWRATDGFGPGNGGDSPTQLAGLTAQDATPNSSDRVDLPTAEDCTVEPLTVDRVMELVEDPYDLATQLTEVDPNATPPPRVFEPSDYPDYPSQEMMDEIIIVHRQVIACSLAKSPFQVWALVDPILIQQDVLGALPVLADKKDVRAYLDQLQTGLMDDQVMVGGSYGVNSGSEAREGQPTILMVDPNPQNSITLPTDESVDVVRPGALYCNRDGVVERTERGVTDAATEGQTYFEYHYRADQDHWVLHSLPSQG